VRLLDVSVAVTIGLLSLGALGAINPGPLRTEASQAERDIALRGYLVSFVQSRGLAWFGYATAPQICAAASSDGGVAALYVEVDGFRCGSPPQNGKPSVQLLLTLGGREVALEAW
jgi:hypothetical protein